jgi:O-antigen/teichoic acid export membrane protein
VGKIIMSRVFQWSKKGSIAILDQTLFNGIHLLLSILLARWLEPGQYGIFAITYSILVLFGAFHMAILIEPMLIFGTGKYKDKFDKYLGVLISGNFFLTLSASFILIVISIFIGNIYNKNMQLALFGLAISLPFILLLWLLRRAFYVNLEPGWSTMGGIAYSGLLLFVVLFLNSKKWLSVATCYLSMGLCSLLISLFLIYRLKPKKVFIFDSDSPGIRKDHFRYGRWSLGTNALTWGVNNAYFVFLPTLIGLEGVAALRALMNLSTPIIQTNSALSFLLLPILCRHRLENIRKMKKTMDFFLVVFISAAAVYLFILLLFGKRLMELVYAGKYSEFSRLIPLVALLPLGSGMTLVLENTLRSMEKPDKVFWSYLAGTFVAIAGAILMANIFGLRGVLYGYNISYLVMVIGMIFFIWKAKVNL